MRTTSLVGGSPVNVDYETCVICHAPTGRAGKNEDSLYDRDRGPFCEDCFEEYHKTRKKMQDMYRAIFTAIRELDQFCITQDYFSCTECPIGFGSMDFCKKKSIKGELEHQAHAIPRNTYTGCPARGINNSASFP